MIPTLVIHPVPNYTTLRDALFYCFPELNASPPLDRLFIIDKPLEQFINFITLYMDTTLETSLKTILISPGAHPSHQNGVWDFNNADTVIILIMKYYMWPKLFGTRIFLQMRSSWISITWINTKFLPGVKKTFPIHKD